MFREKRIEDWEKKKKKKKVIRREEKRKEKKKEKRREENLFCLQNASFITSFFGIFLYF